MIGFEVITLLLIIVTVFISYKGFNNELLTEGYCFDVEKILVRKDYIRLVSSGFLHIGWRHLLFNMLALYAFGSMLETLVGGGKFLLIYFLSLIGGGLVSLLVHKNHGDYTSVGASGAVNGIVYAAIALDPNMGIGFFLLPVSIPAWAFGTAYILFTIYGIKAKWGNSGHTAHLGGALTGMLLAIAMYPEVIQVNYLPILCILLPTIAFLTLVIYKPHILLIDNFSARQKRYSIDQEYNNRKAQEQADIDSILEKIHRRGMKSLSLKEKRALEEYSRMRK